MKNQTILVACALLFALVLPSKASEYLQSVDVSSSNAINPEFAVDGDTLNFIITTDLETEIESVSVESLSTVPTKVCSADCVYSGAIVLSSAIELGKITLNLNHGVVEGFGEVHTMYFSDVKFVNSVAVINKFSDIAISSNNSFSNYAVNGDEISLKFTTQDASVTVTSVDIAGKSAAVSSVNNAGKVNYTAKITVDSSLTPQVVSFQVNSSDGTITEVSDGSSVEIVDVSNSNIFNDIYLVKGSVNKPKQAKLGDELAFVFELDRSKFDLTTFTAISTPDGVVSFEDTDCNFATCTLTTPSFELSSSNVDLSYAYNFLGTAASGVNSFSLKLAKADGGSSGAGSSTTTKPAEQEEELTPVAENSFQFIATTVDYDGLNGDLLLSPIGKLPAVVTITNADGSELLEEELVALAADDKLTRISGNKFISLVNMNTDSSAGVSLSSMASLMDVKGISLKSVNKRKLNLMKKRKVRLSKVIDPAVGRLKIKGKRFSKNGKFAFLLSDGTYQSVRIRKKKSKAFRQVLAETDIPENAVYAIYYTQNRGTDYIKLD